MYGVVKTATETLKPVGHFLLKTYSYFGSVMCMFFAWCSYESPNAYFSLTDKVNNYKIKIAPSPDLCNLFHTFTSNQILSAYHICNTSNTPLPENPFHSSSLLVLESYKADILYIVFLLMNMSEKFITSQYPSLLCLTFANSFENKRWVNS
jgi:hypothetical protein